MVLLSIYHLWFHIPDRVNSFTQILRQKKNCGQREEIRDGRGGRKLVNLKQKK